MLKVQDCGMLLKPGPQRRRILIFERRDMQQVTSD
jgi:hypothetical protein